MSSRFIADEGDFRVTRGGRDITADTQREAKASRLIDNIFCKTGQGGGVDPTCTKDAPDTGGGSGGSGGSSRVQLGKDFKSIVSTHFGKLLRDLDTEQQTMFRYGVNESFVPYGDRAISVSREGTTVKIKVSARDKSSHAKYSHLSDAEELKDVRTKVNSLKKALVSRGFTVKIGDVQNVANAFPPAAGGAPAGGTTRPKLDMPLLPENLRIADGEADPNAVEVSRDDLLKIKEVIDRLLSEHDAQQQAGVEDQSSPDGTPSSGAQQAPAKDDVAAQDVTDTSAPEKSFPADKSKDDINKEDALPQQDAAAAADGEQNPLKRKYKGFFNAT